jgi:transcriptional regulator GlxA family with amidase domain
MERVFKQETGDSIWNYLNNIRMENAVYYLTQSNIPIGDIDELVGIHSRQNFYLLFKNKYQVSPSQYRKRHT